MSDSLFQSCKMNKLCYHTILTQNHVMLDLSCNIIRSTVICLTITYIYWFPNSEISFLLTCHPQPVEDKQCRKSFNILVYNAVLRVKHWMVIIQLRMYYNITARTFLIIWPNNNCIKVHLTPKYFFSPKQLSAPVRKALRLFFYEIPLSLDFL